MGWRSEGGFIAIWIYRRRIKHPLSIFQIFIDLGAERVFGAEKDDERIAVEVKTFGNPSFITALYEAVGKYVVYRKALRLEESDRTLYLAMPEDVYIRYSAEPLFVGTLEDENVNVILFETDIEKITKWIKR